jgi:acyl-CoA oxidase
MLQTARILMKSAAEAKKGIKTLGPYSYISKLTTCETWKSEDLKKFAPNKVNSVEKFIKLDYLESLFEYNALFQVTMTSNTFEEKLKETGNIDTTRNELQVELITAVKAHCHYFMIVRFIKAIEESKEKDITEVLTNLCQLMGISFILEFQWAGVIESDQLVLAKEASSYILKKLRPNACALVDSFDIPDRVLNSTIGKYDGNVYEVYNI